MIITLRMTTNKCDGDQMSATPMRWECSEKSRAPSYFLPVIMRLSSLSLPCNDDNALLVILLITKENLFYCLMSASLFKRLCIFLFHIITWVLQCRAIEHPEQTGNQKWIDLHTLKEIVTYSELYVCIYEIT